MRRCAHATVWQWPAGSPLALTELLRANSVSIASGWASKAGRILARHGSASTLPTARQMCAAGVAAMAECTATMSIRSVDAYLDRLTATRLDQGFELPDVIEEFLLLQEAVLPHIRERVAGGPDSWFPIARRLTDCVRCVSVRLCAKLAALEHDRLRGEARLEERHRVAREIHDSMTQSIYSIGLIGDAAARNIQAGRLETTEAQLRRISDSVRELLGEMRIRIFDLHPPALDGDGLPEALRSRLASVEARAGLDTAVIQSGDVRPPRAVEEQLLWIAHEVLNNTLKHARAKKVEITIDQQPDGVVLEVADDGVGFELPQARERGGRGLSGIEERARAIGAELSLHSEVGRGTRVRVAVRSERDVAGPAEPSEEVS